MIQDPKTLTREQRAEVLENAARALEVFGWTKGSLHRRNGEGETVSVCAVGAIGLALGYTFAEDDYTATNRPPPDYYGEAARVWGFEAGGGGLDPRGIANWNDAHAKTKEQVTGRLRDRAATLRETR